MEEAQQLSCQEHCFGQLILFLIDCLWVLLRIKHYLPTYLTVPLPLFAIVNYGPSLLATASHFLPLLATACHCQPLLANLQVSSCEKNNPPIRSRIRRRSRTHDASEGRLRCRNPNATCKHFQSFLTKGIKSDSLLVHQGLSREENQVRLGQPCSLNQ